MQPVMDQQYRAEYAALCDIGDRMDIVHAKGKKGCTEKCNDAGT